jgi:hypothetical protein
MGKDNPSNIVAIVPREFVTQPFFPARKQTTPRVLEFGGVRWTIGAPRPDQRQLSPAMDIRHGRLCFALLSFRERGEDAPRAIRFSLNELAHRLATANNGTYSRQLLELLFDLRDTWVRLDHQDGSSEQFSIIESIRVNTKPVRRSDALAALSRQGELWLDFVNLSPEFFGLLNRIQMQAGIRLDVLNSISSPTAQTIYTYLPSRAVHHGAGDPFEITLTTLMQQIGLNVPKQKSIRREVFTQNSSSIIDQLNGAETLTGVLHVGLTETNDGTDYKLRAWVERTASIVPAALPERGLLKAWKASGRSKLDFDERIRAGRPLTDHQVYLIERSGAELVTNERFFRMAAALLGHRFETILAEAKGDALEGRPARNPTGRLIWRLMDAVKKPAR